MKNLFKLSILVFVFTVGCQMESSVSNETSDDRTIDNTAEVVSPIIGVWQDDNVSLEDSGTILSDFQISEEITVSVIKYLILTEDTFQSYFNIILSGDSELIETTIIDPIFADQGETQTDAYLQQIKIVNDYGEVVYDLSYSTFGRLVIEEETVGTIYDGTQAIGVTMNINSPSDIVDTFSWSINDNDQLHLSLIEKLDVNSHAEYIAGIYTLIPDDVELSIPEIVQY